MYGEKSTYANDYIPRTKNKKASFFDKIYSV